MIRRLTIRKDSKEGIKSAMRTGLLKKGSGQEFDFLSASHEQQPGKKIKLYSCDK
jgi:hypothetical protein